MRQSLRIFACMYAGWVLLFVLAKVVFMACYHTMYAGIGAADVAAVIWHGLKMDMSVAGYLTALPGLVLTAGAIVPRGGGKWVRAVLKVYTALTLFVAVTIIGVDTALYGYWDFKLDITPLYYVMTDPAAAVASAPVWMVAGGVVAVLVLTWGLYRGMTALCGIGRYRGVERRRAATSGVMLLCTGVLFLPIRGGVGVSTVNLSSAFYSDNMRLNHAAVNPAFSLLYSAAHQQSFDKMFRLLPPADAAALMSQATHYEPYVDPEAPLLATARPDIYIIILESFSDALFPSLGGEAVATRLDSLAASGDGLLFTDFYSSTFRTDRALPAILNAFPSQPTTSLSKYPEKTRHIPSLARTLGRAGYGTAYYYGGDATFANKKTFLLNSGFDRVVTEKDLGYNDATGKWGVPDGKLFEFTAAEAAAQTDTVPQLRVIQTLSSHEPFEVPYHNPRWAGEPACNAFAYTDSCAVAFVDALHASPRWDNTLIIIVPDHYGCYPRNPDPTDVVTRHRIPLIMSGGALARHGRIDRTASQVDIAATLLDAMGLDRSDFTYSRNILDPATRLMAFMSTPTYTAVVDSTGVASVYNIETRTFRGSAASAAMTPTDSLNAAYLQTIYDTMEEL